MSGLSGIRYLYQTAQLQFINYNFFTAILLCKKLEISCLTTTKQYNDKYNNMSEHDNTNTNIILKNLEKIIDELFQKKINDIT